MGHSNIFTFIGFFFAGLVVNLTPCVYPMLTVTTSLFKNTYSPSDTFRRSFFKALAYFLGIVVMYSALGYFAAASGKIFGSVLQNTWVLLSISVMMFILALSMFGLFQLQFPSNFLNRLGGVRKGNYLELLVSGMFVGVFAAPCVGPPVIALLTAVANNGNPVFGLSAFFVFSLGLGLPYLLFGTFSGFIDKLPKAGGWLIWVEHALGVILFGFGFFYLLSALHSNLVQWLLPVGLIAGGIYLGFFERAGNERRGFVRFKWTMGIIAFLAGVLVFTNISTARAKVIWQPYTDQKVTAAISHHKPVVIDFYAAWCISCHELDRTVFASPKVAARLSQLVTLRVDLTDENNPQAQSMIERYNLLGLPTVVFLDTQGREIKEAKVQGIISLKEFLRSLDMVRVRLVTGRPLWQHEIKDENAMGKKKQDQEFPDENLLKYEKSPYLLQHADNPVWWYPWGEKAFAKANAQDRPIFLSIGYSTCHWCHVMEQESYSDPHIAKILNDNFVAIKVDREERPDIDNIYMKTVEAMTGSGGWPLNVFLTPDLKPFYGGTYFPPTSRWGRPGLDTVLTQIAKQWKNNKPFIMGKAMSLQEGGALRKSIRIMASGLSNMTNALNQDMLKYAYGELRANFDDHYGGFIGMMKFPSSHTLSFLLRYWIRSHDPQALAMVEKTLQAMSNGGIHDQIGGGFHRYSTDPYWRVPHFEKMLYDQAILSMTYLEAYQATGKKDYAGAARDILDYVLRDMTSAEGVFYSAEDADSQDETGEKKEGSFYLWSANEVADVLGKADVAVFDYYFGVEAGGNMRVKDFGSKNILYVAHTIEQTTHQFGKSVEEAQKILQQGKAKLLSRRSQRPRPFRDDKVLTDWNGLMITSFATAAQVLNEPRYAQAAQKAMDFFLVKMKRSDGRLMHRYRKGESAIGAFLDDYAFLTQGLLASYEATFNPQYLQQAKFLADEMIRLFEDKAGGGFFFTAPDGQTLIGRTKDAYDGAIPSGNSAAALVLVKLGRLMVDRNYEQQGAGTVNVFSDQIKRSPSGFTHMLSAFDYLLGPSREIVIAGDQNNPDTQEMLHEVHLHFIPNKVLCLHPMDQQQAKIIEALAPFVKEQKSINGKTTVYVCTNHVCQLPVTDMALKENFGVKSNDSPQGGHGGGIYKVAGLLALRLQLTIFSLLENGSVLRGKVR
jgi:uncharacterized protein YyaL (SSP411 family)/cytochrome c biogenesis protein CcdA